MGWKHIDTQQLNKYLTKDIYGPRKRKIGPMFGALLALYCSLIAFIREN